MTSEDLYERALKVMPGGVNSPVRACRRAGATPRFMASGRGSRIRDVEGREYIDYVMSWGPLILGHARPEVVEAVVKAAEKGLTFGAPTEREVEMAELLRELVPSMEKSRMVSSGTEAVMSAVRLARGATGRDDVVKFAGCYHGHSDGMLVKAGSGALTGGAPDSAGVPADCARHTMVAPYNDAKAVEEIFAAAGGRVAAVIVEPVAANAGVIPPAPGFLESLREITRRNGALLIFDEVITGFRLGLGGAQEYYGVAPDITVLGKIVGGGMPAAAYGGSAALMGNVAPDGGVYQAGTLSGNPLATAAGLATLKILKREKGLYGGLERMSAALEKGLRKSLGGRAPVTRVASMLGVDFGSDAAHGAWYRGLLERGVCIAPSRFEAMFVSAAHSADDVAATLAAAGSLG